MLRERRRHANFKPNRKLDRKSSRGMIYENEELRIRTININAEVERGQSDIKKLLRENYRLRTENWTLRDEYDRLDKLLKTKNQSNATDSHEFQDCNKHGYEYDDSDRYCGCCGDEDSVSCDMCNDNEHCVKDIDEQSSSNGLNCDKVYGTTKKSDQASMPGPVRNDKINMNFDHLSVVSEECLSNGEDQSSKTEAELAVEAIYNNFQSTIPPLKHFENLSYKDIGPNVDSLGEIHFDGEMYQANEPTPPPPTPPPLTTAQNRRSTSLPLPPPPNLNEDGAIVQQNTDENENETKTGKNSPPKYFFAPLKSKRKSSICPEMRPDVLFVNNIVSSDGSRVATIRKPHNPLKYPSNLNAASIDPEAPSQSADIQGLSKSVENMQMQPQSNRIYENVTTEKHTDADQSPPFRTEMSLVLSYDGNKSKYSTNRNSTKQQESDQSQTPPPCVPMAMKLLPKKLPYTGQSDLIKRSAGSSQEVEQSINVENSANEELLSKTRVNSVAESTESNGSKKKSSGKSEKTSKTGEIKANGGSNNSSEERAKQKHRDSNDSQESKEADGSSKSNNSNETLKDSRRVSIHCNGISVTDQPDNEPHSNDSDFNTATELSEEELMAMMPIALLRGRRTSCSRKVSEELGSFLYPPNPFGFGAHKARGRRPSFLSRRHSDGIVPSRVNQYIPEYELAPKTPSRCHCHRNHANNNHLGPDYNGEMCTHMGGSTASSICNNMASSRDSLGNISQQSSRRKLSITSHSKSGGKIPWCACWGNGCL